MSLDYLADIRCSRCSGFGRRRLTCGCVFRRVARIALERLHSMQARGPHWNYHIYSREAEYSADLWLIAKRVLTAPEQIIYSEYLLQQRPWLEVEPMTKLGRGQFFHHVYRAESKLGRALIEARLLPHDYFGGLYHVGLASMAGPWRSVESAEEPPRLPLSTDRGGERAPKPRLLWQKDAA